MGTPSRTPRWAVVLTGAGATLALAAGATLAVLGALPLPLPDPATAAELLPATPYTISGTLAGLAMLVFGGWLLVRLRRGARRRRQTKAPRAAAGGGDARGEAAALRGYDGGRAAAITITLILPLTPAGYPAGGRRAGQLAPLAGRPTPGSRSHVTREACLSGAVAAPDRGAGAATYSSRRGRAGDRRRRAVAAAAWNPEAATTDTLPAIRDPQTWTARADATGAGLNETHQT